MCLRKKFESLVGNDANKDLAYKQFQRSESEKKAKTENAEKVSMFCLLFLSVDEAVCIGSAHQCPHTTLFLSNHEYCGLFEVLVVIKYTARNPQCNSNIMRKESFSSLFFVLILASKARVSEKSPT